MLIWARRAIGYTSGLDHATFAAHPLVQDATIRCLAVVGEAAARLSDEFRAEHPHLELHAIVGMRNRLVHEYGIVDLEEVWSAATHDCPELLRLLTPLVPADDEHNADPA